MPSSVPPFTPTGRTALSHRRPLNTDTFWFGVCYYPEHWDAATRAQDPERMAAAGINTVRLGDFAWDVLEPREGRYDFRLFDETITALAHHGIATVFCTPTAGPPRWLTHKHPEILRQNADGVPMRHGSRQHASYAHPIFRDYSRRITRVLAEHFRNNPHILGWQTDNEIYCHFGDDHGPEMQPAFRDFLRRIYGGNIAALNQAWGTRFWAQTYNDFEEIETPQPKRPTYPNPGQMLDYARFLSDVAAIFQHDQVEILRAANPRWKIFHNGIMRRTDYRGPFTQDLDFLGFDIYPFFDNNPSTRAYGQAFNNDRTRSYAGNFLVPEHQSNYGGQPDYLHNTPEPGEMRLLTLSSISRGADGIIYFRWRTCRFGAEIYWGGILDHDNVPRRRYDELCQFGAEIQRLGPAVLGTSVHLDVAIATGDYAVREAHDTYPMGLPSEQLIAESTHRVFLGAGYAVGCVHPQDDLEGLKLYIIPHWAVFDPAWVPRLRAWVEAGGTLILGARTASRDLSNRVVPDTLPGCLADLAGVTVEDYGKENPGSGRTKKIRWGKTTLTTEWWSEVLKPGRGTRVVARWQGRHFTGQPAATLRPLGRGRVITLGTYLTEPLVRGLLPVWSKLADLKKLWPAAPRGVHVVRRDAPGRTLWFFLNHTDKPVTLRTVPRGRDLLTDKPTGPRPLRLPLHGAAVIQTPTRGKS